MRLNEPKIGTSRCDLTIQNFKLINQWTLFMLGIIGIQKNKEVKNKTQIQWIGLGENLQENIIF